jgi:hypothetical protein
MADKAVAAKAVDAGDEDQDEIEDDAPAVKAKEPLTKGRKEDPFGEAFEAAEKEIEGETTPAKKPAKPAKVKAEEPEDDEPEEKKPVKKPDPKPKKTEKEVEAEADDADQDEDDEEAVEAKAAAVAKKKAEKEAAEKAKPLAVKPYWSRDRRDAFKYQPREVQEAWLAENPVPHGHWSEEQKTSFTKLPREGQEMLLVQAQEIERGYGQKFEALANERKLAESIKAAVPTEIRQVMARMNLDEPGLLAKLSTLQLQSMKDPAGYIRHFIATNKIDPRHIFPALAQSQANGESNGQDTGYQAPAQADITSHPVVQGMAAELNALKEVVQGDRRQREEENERRRADDIAKTVDERDEEGNSRYPYIRLLSVPMADLIESNPERFSSMGVKEQIAEAYRLALEAFPELTPPRRPASPAPVDEQEDEDADAEKEAEAAKLKQAATKKSTSPQAAPSTSGDPFTRAFNKASRQTGQR